MKVSNVSFSSLGPVQDNTGVKKAAPLAQLVANVSNTAEKPLITSFEVLKRIIGEEKAFAVNSVISYEVFANGIAHEKVNKQSDTFVYPPRGSNKAKIYATMKVGSRYDAMHITHGANDLDVLHTPDNVFGKNSNDLLKDNNVKGPKAFINGGFSAFLTHMLIVRPATGPGQDPNRDSSAIPTGDKYQGHKIGHADGCDNKLPIPGEWRDDYGHIVKDKRALLSCGPYLNDEDMNFADQRFNYYYANGQKNLAAYFQGNLTHCGNPNPRAAISINEEKDVTLHTLTTNRYKRDLGVTMSEWKDIVAQGAPNSTSLNLDGAGSISMGYISASGKINQIAKGDEKLRPVANVLTIGSPPINNANQPTASIERNINS
ncbi:MAG: phosphodiester glycosidase family protein [Enterobacterales bacterium endosymbiont of Blomia tropicalis]|uniref:phosphodiester glycosidase family protein n=1 Tax=Mixta mediterraneensis TaxID=2758443 RepID=UPI0025A8DA73|nr:phosphodiester glycosidase family protein [Mixta mediterraneensis]MDL4915977.1 phosphodiester glycosidase family protein [Mixta mediterraneensis]